MIKDIIYTFNKSDYFYYIFTYITLFIIINKMNIMTMNNFISMIFTFMIMYVILTNKISRDMTDMDIQNNKLEQIQIFKYPFLKQDIYIIDCIHKLQSLSLLNRIKFNTMLEHLNKFFECYTMSKNINLRPSDLYFNARDHSINVINILKSFVIDLNRYPYIESDRNISLDKVVTDNNSIYKCREVIKLRLSIYLNEIEQKINNDWNNDNVNIYSHPIYADDPLPYSKSKYQDIY